MKEYFSTKLRKEFLELREKVFIAEQGFDYEQDEIDKTCYHAGIYDEERPVAVGRAILTDESKGIYKLGRIAVDKEYRGSGLGRQVVELMEREIKKLGAKEIFIDSQLHARPFYERIGYTAVGDIFLEEGVKHIKVIKYI